MDRGVATVAGDPPTARAQKTPRRGHVAAGRRRRPADLPLRAGNSHPLVKNCRPSRDAPGLAVFDHLVTAGWCLAQNVHAEPRTASGLDHLLGVIAAPYTQNELNGAFANVQVDPLAYMLDT
jgi:hypothetical protein